MSNTRDRKLCTRVIRPGLCRNLALFAHRTLQFNKLSLFLNLIHGHFLQKKPVHYKEVVKLKKEMPLVATCNWVDPGLFKSRDPRLKM